MLQVFISYSSKNRDYAFKIYDELTKVGVECWMDARNICPGDQWDRAINQALDNSTHMIYLHTQDARDSDNVWDEWSYFRNRRKPVIPVILEDGVPLPYRLERLHFIDFVNKDFDEALKLLIQAIAGGFIPDPKGSGRVQRREAENISDDKIRDVDTVDTDMASDSTRLTFLNPDFRADIDSIPRRERIINQAEQIVNVAFQRDDFVLPVHHLNRQSIDDLYMRPNTHDTETSDSLYQLAHTKQNAIDYSSNAMATHPVNTRKVSPVGVMSVNPDTVSVQSQHVRLSDMRCDITIYMASGQIDVSLPLAWM